MSSVNKTVLIYLMGNKFSNSQIAVYPITDKTSSLLESNEVRNAQSWAQNTEKKICGIWKIESIDSLT